jgi:hypothetical protein
VRFPEFLRTSVLLFAAAATALAAVAIVGAAADDNRTLIAMAVGWWVITAIAGGWLGRGREPTGAIAKMLADSRSSPMLPDVEPGRTMLNRLWPLALFVAVAGGVAFVLPQVAAIGAGYAIAIALMWRKQSRAVSAIEDRDGVRFYVERSSALGPTKLLRTPWMKKIEPS